MRNSNRYSWLSNYSLLFIWAIIYSILTWWITYIKNPSLSIDYRIGYIDRSLWGLKQTLLNFPILLSLSISIAFQYFITCSLVYLILRLFNRSQYHIYISIPIITIISLLKLEFAYPFNELGVVWFEREVASKQVLEMVSKCITISKTLGIVAFFHFVILLIINRKQPFSRFININVFTFFALWILFYLSQLTFTATKFRFLELLMPNSHFRFGLLWILICTYLIFRKVNWTWLFVTIVAFIISILFQFDIRYQTEEFISLVLVFTAYFLILFGIFSQTKKRRILLTVGILVFMVLCIFSNHTYDLPDIKLDLIPYSWSGIII